MAKAEKAPRNSNQLIGEAVANASRQMTVWFFVLAPLVLIYLWAGFSPTVQFRPLSRFLDLPPNHAEAWLVDLVLVAAPLLGAIALYLWHRAAADMRRRRAFVAAFAGRRLVQASHNPNLIYAVLETEDLEGTLTMQLVWTTDGPCRDGDTYQGVRSDQVAPFDQQLFLKQ